MFNWINFFNFIFIFTFFIFILNSYNFFFLLILSEILWVLIFILNIVYSLVIDDSFLISFSFFILGFASIELSLGILILIFLKQINLSLNISENFKNQLKMYELNFLKKSKNKLNI